MCLKHRQTCLWVSILGLKGNSTPKPQSLFLSFFFAEFNSEGPWSEFEQEHGQTDELAAQTTEIATKYSVMQLVPGVKNLEMRNDLEFDQRCDCSLVSNKVIPVDQESS